MTSKEYYAYMDRERPRLVREYPFLLPKKYDDDWNIVDPTDEEINNAEYSYADSVPMGWWLAFGEKMCSEIKDALLNSGGNDALRQYCLEQVKEKYGELRWYDSCGTKEVDQIVDKYCDISVHTCCVCGEEATRLSTGWICPYCDNCDGGSRNGKYIPIA